MNNKAMSGGAVLLIIAVLVIAYMAVPQVQDTVNGIFNKGSTPTPEEKGKCPSSGLTEVTLNTQEALAATATNAQVDYFVFDKDGNFVTTANSGSDGQSVFDVKCAVGKKYDLLVINETVKSGSYGQQAEIDASEATDTLNLKVYEYGEINLVSVASSVDPLGKTNVSAGLGKTCGFTITFSENESASAYNKPLIMCEANVTSVTDVTMSGVDEANSKAPSRISPTSGYKYYTYELNKLLKSTDAAQKISGTIQFSSSTTPAAEDTMSCKIVDQAMWKKADYQTLSLKDGFLTAAENEETSSDIGAPDTAASTMSFNHASGYC